MAVTLAQAALLSTDDLQRGVIETFVQASPVLDRLPLMQIEGNAYAYNKEATLPGVAFRSVNEAYVESTGTVVQASESLVILGGDAAVVVPWEMYRSDGDLRVLADQWDSMRARVDLVDRLTDHTGLWNEGFQLGDWLDPAAPPDRRIFRS